MLFKDVIYEAKKEIESSPIMNYPYEEKLMLNQNTFVMVTNEAENKIRIGLETIIDNK